MAIIFDGTQGITSPGGDTSNTSHTTPIVKSSANLIFQTSGSTEAMRITTAQNVGIGTTAPSFLTEIVGGATTVETTLFQVRSRGTGINTGTTIALGNSTNPTAGSGRVELAALRDTSSGGSFVIRTGDDSGNIQERMRLTSAGLLQFNSGYGSVATAYGCRAWVNFNGTGTVSIRGSGNVSSITDNGVGDYTVNFTTAMPDANYGYNVSAERTLNNNGDGPKPGVRNGGVATGSIRLLMPRQTSSSGETYDTDWTGVSVSIFR